MPLARAVHDANIWMPPAGWQEVRPGVWEPQGYESTKWEIPAPAILSREVARQEYAKCLKSLPYFAFTAAWTVDVDDPMGSSIRKIPAYPYLRRFFEAVQTPTTIHVDKSRQMLASWAWMVVFLWDILFHDNWPDFVISKKATAVDDGGINSTHNSNLGKVRFVYNHLPAHLWEPFEIKAYSIRNVVRNSHITGETSSGGKASRGGVFRRGLMDEAAWIERSETVFTALTQASKQGLALTSTPNGKGNVFWSIKAQPNAAFKKLSLHWSEHPRKAAGAYCACGEWRADRQSNLLPHEQYVHHRAQCPLPESERRMRSPWYDNECRRLLNREEAIAAELDISYERSRRGRVWYAFDHSLHTFDHTQIISLHDGQKLGERRRLESEADYRVRYLKAVLDPTLQPVVGWDFGVEPSATVMLLGQVIDENSMFVKWLDIEEDTNKSYKYYGQFFLDVWLKVWIELNGPMWYDFAHYGDPSGANRGSDLMSWVSNLRLEPYNIQIQRSHIRKPSSKSDWLDFVNDLYRGNRSSISTFAALLIDTMEQYHYPVDENGQPIMGRQEPVQDEWSHAADAKRYVYQGRWPNRLRVREIKAAERQRHIMATSGRGRAVEVREW